MKKKFETALKNLKQKITKPKRQAAELPVAELPPEPVAENRQRVIVDISAGSVFRASLVVLGVFVLSQIFFELVDIVVMFLLALFLSSAFAPGVSRLEKMRIPRPLGIILLFVAVFGLAGAILGTLVPVMAVQITEIAVEMRGWMRGFITGDSAAAAMLASYFDVGSLAKSIEQNLNNIASSLADVANAGVSLLSATLGAVFNVGFVLLLTFFLTLSRQNLSDFFRSLFPARHQWYLIEKTGLVQEKIGEWVHGQVALFFIVGGLAYVGLLLIGVPYALTLAMVAGLAELVPYVGPVVAFATAAPVAFSDSLTTGLLTMGFFAALQVFEGNVIVPLVMRRAVGLPPLVTILALVIGASFPSILNPVVGMIMAVPVATIISLFVQDFTTRHADNGPPPKKVKLLGRKRKL